MRHFLFALMFFIFISAFGQANQPDEWEFWRKGFSSYENAEQDLLAGNKKEALSKFKTALDYFDEVKKLRPEWNKKAIDYRIELCNKKIEQLSKQAEDEKTFSGKASALSSDLLKPFKTQDPKKSDSTEKVNISELKKEVEKYKANHFEVTVELENLKKESEKNKRAAEEISSILQEKFDLEKKYTELQSKYESLKKKEPAVSPETEDLKKKLVQAKTEEDKLKKEIGVLQTENDTLKSQKQELIRNKTQLNYDIKTSSEKQAELLSELKNLKAKQAEHDKTVEGVKNKLQTAEKQFEEYRLRYETKTAESDKYLKELKELRAKTDIGTASKQIETDNEQLRKNVESLQQRFDKISEENTKSKQALSSKNVETKDLSDTLAALKRERDAVSEEFKLISTKFDKTEQLTKSQKKYISELEERNNNLSADIKKFADGYQGAQDKLKNKEISSKPNQDSQEAEKKAGAIQAEIQELNKKFKEVSENNKKLEKTLSMLTDEKIALDKNFNRVKTENETLKKELASQKKDPPAKAIATAQPEKAPAQAPAQETVKAVEPESGMLGNIKKQMEEVNNRLAEYKKQFVMPSSEYTVMPQSISSQMGQDFKINQPMRNPNEQEVKQEQADKQKEVQAAEKQKTAQHKKLNDDNITLLLKNALKAETENDSKSAIWHYNKILQSQPENFEAIKKLGLLYATQNDDDNALEYLNNAYKIKDDDIDVTTGLVTIYMKKQKYSQALDILNRAIVISPKSAVVHRYLAILCHKTGKKEFAEKEFAKSLELDPDSSETTLSKAFFLADNKTRMNEARDLYLKAVKMGAKPTQETEKIFSPSEAGQKDKKKTASFDGISKVNPESNIKPITATADTKKTKPSQEIEKNKVDNDTVDFLVREAENAENEGDCKTAAWHISKAILLVPMNAEVQKKAGRIFLKNFNEEKSLAAYEAAYRIKNDDIDIILPLSSIYIKYGKYTQALEILNVGTVLDPQNASLQRNIAIACKNTGKKELADKAFRKAFELDPKSPDTALEMALFLAFACHKNDEASDWYMKAKELGAKPNTLLDRIARK